MELKLNTRQIVHRVGLTQMCRITGVRKDAPRKWYERGIPARHWPTLVKKIDWIDYQTLEDATAIAQRRRPRAQ